MWGFGQSFISAWPSNCGIELKRDYAPRSRDLFHVEPTWSFRTAKLAADKEALRLMMAQNDIAMANEGLGEWTVTRQPRKLFRQNGGRLYYGRMLMALVFEAPSIIEVIQGSSKLKALVDACDLATRSSFDAVAAFLKTPDYGMLCRIRNNASFHYDGELAVRARSWYRELLKTWWLAPDCGLRIAAAKHSREFPATSRYTPWNADGAAAPSSVFVS